MKILQLSVHFQPNIGGVETHLWDLVKYLSVHNFGTYVLSYQPLSTKTKWKIYEKEKNLEIFRIPWIRGLFYKFIPYPILQFLYLFPGLFFFTPFIILTRQTKTIHAHGIVAGAVAGFWKFLGPQKVIISTHSLYSFPKSGFYRSFVKLVFGQSDKILCLSEKSRQEILSLGVDVSKVEKFTYWIDLEKFKYQNSGKNKYKWKEKFVVLFVGRLVSEKGLEPLLESAKKWYKNIGLVIAGTGPLEGKINSLQDNYENIHFLGKVSQNDLPYLYSSSNLVIVPSTSEEGFGRVILESLACSIPVIAANKGSISEVMDKSVGELIDVNEQNIKKTIEHYYENPNELRLLSSNCRKYAERRYSQKNAQQIVKAYTK